MIMNRNRIYHGLFGRVVLLDMVHPLVTHAHPQPHIIVKIGGCDGAMEVYGRNLPLTSETVGADQCLGAAQLCRLARRTGLPARVLPRSGAGSPIFVRRAAICASSSVACRARRN